MIRIKGADQEPLWVGKGKRRKRAERPPVEKRVAVARAVLRDATRRQEAAAMQAARVDLRNKNDAATRRRGRPKGPATVALPIRLPADQIARIDAWAGKRGVTRTAAIRALLERGLG